MIGPTFKPLAQAKMGCFCQKSCIFHFSCPYLDCASILTQSISFKFCIMKNSRLLSLVLAILCLGIVLSSCQPDNVSPEADGKGPSLAADENDPHPLPDPVCSEFDTVLLAAENGSLTVNYCGSFGGQALPCPPNMPEWGYVELLNGRDIMIANFTMAIGWFIDFSRSSFATGNSYQLNQNGIPIISNDWIPVNVDPVVNKWQLVLQLDSLPTPCFTMGLNLIVVKLDFFSGVDANSTTSLWGYNTEWNNPNSNMASPSPFLTGWCPSACPGDLPDPDSICVVAYPGLPNNAGCATLTPDVSGATGAVSYEWSTSETTTSITVCPTVSTDYTVTVTDDNGAYAVNVFNVNAEDVICTRGNRPTPKVYVCHIPPGNPDNPQTICIDWSGVPAHVEAFRTPQMNPNHGHDSGCHIGPCNSNPCPN